MTTTIRTGASVLAWIAAALLAVAPAGAQRPDYEEQVRQQILASAMFLSDAGYRLSDYYSGELGHREWEEAQVMRKGRPVDDYLWLEEGVEHAFVGACDEDCYDLDLRLYDENENLIDADELEDDLPTVEVVPSWSGRFYLEVRMLECAISPCYYGVGHFKR